MSLYRGFSTINRNYKFRVTDYELAKQDLINHLQIRKGEKLMNPEFGTTVWNMLFENMSENFKSEIVNEIIRVAKYDPRFTVGSVDVVEYEHGIQVELNINFVGIASPTTLLLDFERDTRTVREI